MKLMRLRGVLDSNTYVISNKNEAICIDVGVSFNECKAALGEKVKISAVLLTHGHFDHCFYAKDFQSNGAKVYINKEDACMLNDASENLSTHFCYDSNFATLNADYYVKDGEILNISGITVKVLHVPGHSQGCVVYVIDDLMFCGDTLFLNSYGRTDLGSNTSHALLKKSIKEKIFSLCGDYILYPGHGPSTTLKYERENNPINYD